MTESPSTESNATPELTERGFEILRSAFNMARYEQIRTLPALRTRLAKAFPNEESDVEAAISTWANYSADRRREELDRDGAERRFRRP